jgi:WD40 repeat protein
MCHRIHAFCLTSAIALAIGGLGALADDAPPAPTRQELLDPMWIEATLADFGIDRLIKLYDRGGAVEADVPVQLVQDALMLSRLFLREHPEELRSQLQARLLSSDEPELQVFQDLPADRVRARATRPSLYQAGDALRQIIPLPYNGQYFVASRDGTLLAIMGRRLFDELPYFIELRSGINGDLLREVNANSIMTVSAGFSPDLSRFYGVTEDGVFHAWDVHSGEEYWNAECGIGRFRQALCVTSPDGRYVAVNNFMSQVFVFDAESGVEVSVLGVPQVEGIIGHIAFVDNDTLVGCCSDEKVRRWNVASGEVIEELDSYGWRLTQDGTKVFSFEAKYPETGPIGDEFNVYDARTGELLVHTEFDKPLPINSMDVDPEGERLVILTEQLDDPDRRIMGYSIASGELIADLAIGYYPGGNLVAASNDRLLTSGPGDVIHVWDLTRSMGQTDLRLRAGHVEITADGAIAMAYSMQGTIWLWDTETWEETASFTIDTPGSKGVMSDDGTRILFIVRDEVQLLDTATGQISLVLKRGEVGNAANYVIALSGDGQVGAVNTQGDKAILFDVNSGEVLATVGSARGIWLSYDGSQALLDNRLLDRNTGMETAFEYQSSFKDDLSDDGRLAIVSASPGGIVWNLESNEQIKDAAFAVDAPGFYDHSGPVSISSDGRFTASCGPNSDVYLYDTRARCQLAVVNADYARIRSLDLSADGSDLLILAEGGGLHHYRFENLPP